MTDQTLPRPASLPQVVAPAGGTVARRTASLPAPRIIDVEPSSVRTARPSRRGRTAAVVAVPSTLLSLAASGWLLARIDVVVQVFMWLGVVAAGVVVATLLILALLSRRKCPGLHCPGCKA